MRAWTMNKRSWQWVCVLSYVAILFLLGWQNVHLDAPISFFAILVAATGALLLILRFLHSGEYSVVDDTSAPTPLD